MDIETAYYVIEEVSYEPGTTYTRDPYQQDKTAYYEAERVLREAGEL